MKKFVAGLAVTVIAVLGSAAPAFAVTTYQSQLTYYKASGSWNGSYKWKPKTDGTVCVTLTMNDTSTWLQVLAVEENGFPYPDQMKGAVLFKTTGKQCIAGLNRSKTHHFYYTTLPQGYADGHKIISPITIVSG